MEQDLSLIEREVQLMKSLRFKEIIPTYLYAVAAPSTPPIIYGLLPGRRAAQTRPGPLAINCGNASLC